MILCINYDNMHHFGGAFSAQFRLRHRCFIERLKYNVRVYQNMEYDQYDTPAANYLVYAGPDGSVQGCSRLTPVTHGSMLQACWPDMVSDHARTFTGNTWEGTRFCVDKNLSPALRQRICQELVLAYLEFGLKKGADKIIGIMPAYILRRVFGNAGCSYYALGESKRIDDLLISSAAMDVSAEQLDRARNKTRIHHSVLREDIQFNHENAQKAA